MFCTLWELNPYTIPFSNHLRVPIRTAERGKTLRVHILYCIVYLLLLILLQILSFVNTIMYFFKVKVVTPLKYLHMYKAIYNKLDWCLTNTVLQLSKDFSM